MNTNNDNHNCLIVNLFGAPGSGKSTGAAYVFSCLKMLGVNAELVTEFAKDMVWDECYGALNGDAQAYVFGCQLYRLLRCKDKVDVIVTDSPILLSVPYNKSVTLGKEFNETVTKMFKSFNNVSYMVRRTKYYETSGRIHTKIESAEMHQKIIDCLNSECIDYTEIEGELPGYHSIVSDVMDILRKKE